MSTTSGNSGDLRICTNSISAEDDVSSTHHLPVVQTNSTLTVVSSIFDSKNALTINNVENQATNTEDCTNQRLLNHQQQEVVNSTSVVDISPHVHVIPEGSSITSVTDNNGAIYLLVSNDTAVLQNFETTQQGSVNVISTETLKSTTCDSIANSTVQIVNSDGVPMSINVNEILSTMSEPKGNHASDSNPISSTGNILNLSSSILSTTESGHQNHHQMHEQNVNDLKTIINHSYVVSNDAASLSHLSMPNWAMHLKDCTLFGDTYTGYVTDENEMDAVLNLYKKETQSLFAIRQTPSPAKDESNETVRLMWKSQYVPYDGIPFVNVGRRATVMECEHGPRKRSNAIKRMTQMRGGKGSSKRLPNLTCPARLFVKKVRKFPQFHVPLDADAKMARVMQEQSLKLVRQAGYKSGEIRLYMQLPLPTAHRYHNIGSTMDLFQRELEETADDILTEPIAVDGRVLENIRELVRQGFVNPFMVRAAVKDFVENKMQMNVQETRPYKHNKAFYPPLIEIQNIIQQTEAAMSSGVLSPLPPPIMPPVSHRSKRKRTTSVEMAGHSPILIKRIKVDASQGVDVATDISTATIVSPDTMQVQSKDNLTSLPCTDSTETISLTLTDNQLENFSVQNFTYDQLAQLAKIGLIALNNAAKDTPSETGDELNENNMTSSTIVTNVDATNSNCVDRLVLIRTDTDIDSENVMKVSELNNGSTVHSNTLNDFETNC